MNNNEPLIRVEHLKTYFPVQKGVFSSVSGWIKAVDDVSLSIPRQATMGLVGESGSGKSTLGRTILRLIPATGGKVFYKDINLFEQPPARMRKLRCELQIVFQDPFGSLNPRMTVGGIIGEAMKVHHIVRGSELQDRVADLLRKVGLPPAYAQRYPHEFSGGQRQRIGIARALALNPEFIVCDEPVSALDVSIQSQIINLLMDLQDEMGLTYLFIAHDLAVVEHISDFVAVMYLGKIMEIAPAAEIYHNPRHPYTMALLSVIPQIDPRLRQKQIPVRGEIPSPLNPPSGCVYHPRCHMCVQRCTEESPALSPKGPSRDHLAACWLTT